MIKKISIVTISMMSILLILTSPAKARKYLYPETIRTPEFQAIFKEVDQHMKNKQFKEAVAEIDKILKQYPDNALIQIDGHHGKGLILIYSLNKPREAIQACESSLALLPPGDEEYVRYWQDGYIVIARSYRMLGEYDKAIATARKIIDKYPDASSTVWGALTTIHKSFKEQGQTEQGIATLNNIAKKYKNVTPVVDIERFRVLGDHYRIEKDYLQAAMTYQEMMDKYPKHEVSAFARSQIGRMVAKGQLKEWPPREPIIPAEKVEEVPPEKVIVRGLTRQQLVRFIGIPLVALIALIYISILIVRWRKKK